MILSMSQQAVLSTVGDIINFAGFDYGIVTTSSFHRSSATVAEVIAVCHSEYTWSLQSWSERVRSPCRQLRLVGSFRAQEKSPLLQGASQDLTAQYRLSRLLDFISKLERCRAFLLSFLIVGSYCLGSSRIRLGKVSWQLSDQMQIKPWNG